MENAAASPLKEKARSASGRCGVSPLEWGGRDARVRTRGKSFPRSPVWHASGATKKLTNSPPSPLHGDVSLFRRVIAIALLALWLPVTQHCGLEAAGLVSAHVPHPAPAQCCDTGGPCSHDGCSLVESGLTKPGTELSKLPAPAFFVLASFLCLQFSAPDSLSEPALVVADSEQPLDWVPAWQFVRRAAPLSRAPSLVG